MISKIFITPMASLLAFAVLVVDRFLGPELPHLLKPSESEASHPTGSC
ncbi:hypothetical protein Pd630_LPD13034 (plasmid) [Rhodococcus opacus PD630]|nr:hypothetical protein Pd630_LPD13034 [Rhodococcus opacus PD630]